MNRMFRYWSSVLLLLLVIALFSCKRKGDEAVVIRTEDKQAKAMLQGIWVDSETEEATFRIKGDTVYYPDSLNQPAFFRVMEDSFQLGNASYPIVKQTAHLFWFRNQNGDLIKLEKSDDPNDVLDFEHQAAPQPITMNKVVKSDSVVMFGGNRYHWYVAINPTRYKVKKNSYNDDGMAVENVYYDNIIHISLFQGAQKLFSRDFRKEMFAKKVPAHFLGQAVLGNMQFDAIDSRGFHFNATLCIPDEASCYLIATIINFRGEVDMQLLEY